jgi:hypothetical protein
VVQKKNLPMIHRINYRVFSARKFAQLFSLIGREFDANRRWESHSTARNKSAIKSWIRLRLAGKFQAQEQCLIYQALP